MPGFLPSKPKKWQVSRLSWYRFCASSQDFVKKLCCVLDPWPPFWTNQTAPSRTKNSIDQSKLSKNSHWLPVLSSILTANWMILCLFHRLFERIQRVIEIQASWSAFENLHKIKSGKKSKSAKVWHRSNRAFQSVVFNSG